MCISYHSGIVLQNKFWLVDINPYSPMTDPLLFTWEELSLGPQGLKTPSHTGSVVQSTQEQQVELPELRLVDGLSIQPSDVQTYKLPQVSSHLCANCLLWV